jgi:S1-C subfamily serine protease
MKTILAISIILLVTISIFSQDLSGVWVGKVWQVSSGAEFVYGMQLEQRGNTAIGKAVGKPSGGGGVGEWDISVTVFSNSILYKDLSVSGSPSPGSSWCLKEGRLNYDARNNRIYGTIEGYSISYGVRTQCPSISFDLRKKEDTPKSEKPTPKSDSNSWAGNGTGFVIDPKGIIATNYHVIKEATEIEADFGKGDNKKSYKCEILESDTKNDLAILRIKDKAFSGFGVLPYSFKTASIKTGEPVFAFGFPKALGILGKEIKYTKGDVSALSGFQGDPTNYTLSLSIQPGNSGGPLFDFNGNLIGITNAKIISPDVDNVSYAIKNLYLKNLVDSSDYKINLPTGTSLVGKPITEQLEILSNYVGLIKVR